MSAYVGSSKNLNELKELQAGRPSEREGVVEGEGDRHGARDEREVVHEHLGWERGLMAPRVDRSK